MHASPSHADACRFPAEDRAACRWSGTLRHAVLAITAIAILTTPAHGQQAQLAIDREPYHAGIPVAIEVTAKGFAGNATPVCQPPTLPPGLAIKSLGQRKNAGFTIQINGRVQSSASAYTFVYTVVSETAGTYTLDPFTLTQGNATAKTQPVPLQFRDVPADPNMRVAIEMPPGPFYVGQRVPITVQWWYAGDLESLSYKHLSIRSPLFDLFTFEDTPPRKGTQLPLETEKETILVNAEVAERTLDGRKFVVVSAPRTMYVDRQVPTAPQPVRATARVVTQWQREIFGGRRAAAYRPIRAEGKPVSLQVEPLSLADAPPGFAGAVGHGFSIAAEADRSVVQVGDPITVTLTVRGDANLDHVSLPALDTGEAQPGTGIDPTQFRASETAAGTVLDEGRAKRFAITLRPLHTGINQIPPLLFAWFDPTSKQFETTQCDPIALQVTTAQMVGAEDVFAPLDSGTAQPTATQRGRTPQPDRQAPGNSRHDLAGADLSIEKEEAILLADHANSLGGRPLRIAIYGGSALLIIFAAWSRRRHRRDPRHVASRKLIRSQVQVISKAATMPRQEAAGLVADALRRLAPLTDATLRHDLDRVVAECDVMAYARGDTGPDDFDPTTHDRAMQIGHRISAEAS